MTENSVKYIERIKELEKEVADLKQQHVEINKAKELYLKIFEDFPALIWRAGTDKLCNYFNSTWLEFTGRTMEQEVGNGWAEGVHPDDFDFCLNIYINAFDKRKAFLMDYRLKNRDGEYRWIRDFGRPFHDLDNTFLGYIGSCYDITDNKNNELKLVELNATKDKFFSIIAHDLLSPFNSILGFAGLLKKHHKKYDAEKTEHLTTQLYSATKSTYNLLENLLEWSRTQSHTIPFKPEKLDFMELCNETADELTQNTGAKNIQLNYNANEPIELYGDKNMLKTIIRNLVSNAIKYSYKEGEVSVYAEKKDEKVTISVSDNGVGIESNNIDKLFDITQIHSEKGTANEKGTGLGLVICKEFTERHGGKIWAESDTEKGATFHFTIPIDREISSN